MFHGKCFLRITALGLMSTLFKGFLGKKIKPFKKCAKVNVKFSVQRYSSYYYLKVLLWLLLISREVIDFETRMEDLSRSH